MRRKMVPEEQTKQEVSTSIMKLLDSFSKQEVGNKLSIFALSGLIRAISLELIKLQPEIKDASGD